MANCVNRSLPEFKALAEQTGMNPVILAAKISVWQDENNNLDAFPEAEELLPDEGLGSAKSGPQEGTDAQNSDNRANEYYQLNSIQKLAKKWNINNQGFSSPQVNNQLLAKEAALLGLGIKRAMNGAWFLTTENGKKINPWKAGYQLNKQAEEGPSKVLNDKLTAWAENNGISVETMEAWKARVEDSQTYPNGIIGVADITRRIIAVAEEKSDITTLPEEAAHFAIELLLDDISVQRALGQVDQTDVYQQVKEEYKDVYTNEIDFRKEALGKILANEIIKKEREASNSPVRAFLTAIKDKFLKIFNRIMRRESARREINEIFAPITENILQGKVIGDTSLLKEGKFYQKEIQIGKKIEKLSGIDWRGARAKVTKPLLAKAREVLFKQVEKEDGSMSHDYINIETGEAIQSTSEYLADKIDKYGISKEELAGNPSIGWAANQGSKVHDTFNSFFNSIDFKVDAASKKLIEPKLRELFNYLKDNYDTIISEVIVSDGITAGTIDIVAIKGDEITLFDLKTMSENGYKNYEKSYSGQLSKRETHAIQLSKYKQLFEDTTGVKVNNLKVVPIILDYQEGTKGKITKIEIPSTTDEKGPAFKNIDTVRITEKGEVIEEMEEGKMYSKRDTKKKIDFLNKAIARLEDRLAILKRSVKKKTSVVSLNLEISRIKKLLATKQYDSAVRTFMEHGTMELNRIDKFLAEMMEKEPSELSPKQISNIVNSKGFAEMYKDLLDSLATGMYGFGYNDTALSDLKSEVDSFLGKIANIDHISTGLLKDLTVNMLEVANRDMYGNVLDPDFNPEDILEKTKEDISKWRLWMGGAKNSKSNILKIAMTTINNVINKVHRFKANKARELLKLQDEAKKAGFKQEVLFEKDSNGKRTGFIISEYNVGQYYENQDKFKEEIAKALGLENFADIKKESLTKEEMAIYKKMWKQWFKENKKTVPVVKEIAGEMVETQEDRLADKYKNPEYARLSGAGKKYYDALIATKVEGLKKLPAHLQTEYHKYLIPQMRKSFLDRMSLGSEESFIKSMARGAKESFVRDVDDTQFGEQSKSGTRLIPIYFNRRLDKMSELTYDLVGSYTKYAEMAENYSEMNQIAGSMNGLLSTLGERTYELKGDIKPGAEIANEYKAVDNLIDHLMYGKEKQEVIWQTPLGDINGTKFISVLARFMRLNNLALNMTTSIAGAMKGRTDAWIEDQIGIYTTSESKWWSRGELYRNLPHVMSEIGHTVQTNKMHLIFENNGVVELDRRLKNSHRGRVARKLVNNDAFYTNYQMADYFMKGRITLAVYDNYRLYEGQFINKKQFIKKKEEAGLKYTEKEKVLRNKKGVDKSTIDKEWKDLKAKNGTLYDAYEVEKKDGKKTGRLIIKPEFKEQVTPRLENVVHNRINHITHISDGTISKEDKGSLSRSIWGDLVLMHRGWVISGIDNRLKSRGMNYENEEMEVGYYRAMGKFLREFARKEESGVRAKMAAWDKLTPIERLGVKKTLLDLAVMNAVAVLAAMINLAADEDDEDWKLNYLAYQSNRILLEAKAFWSPKEFLEIMDEPVAGARIIKDLFGLFDEGFSFSDDSRLKRGMYKDWTKGGKWWFKKLPIKNLYEMQYPKDKNRFIKSILDSSWYSWLGGGDDERSVFNPLRWFEANSNTFKREDGALSKYAEPEDPVIYDYDLEDLEV